MSRIKISDNGIETVRGNGSIEHVDSNNKGFVTAVKSSGTLTLGSSGSDLSTGINIPANAILQWVSIKVLTLGVDANATDYTAHTIDGFKWAGQTVAFGTAIDVFTGGDAVGTILSFHVGGVNTDGDGDEDGALEAAYASSSNTVLTLTDNITGTYTAGDDTLPQVEVVVQYIAPQF